MVGLLTAWAALLLLAPPESNDFWALNGFHSLPGKGRAALAVVALGFALPAAFRLRSRLAWWLMSVALGLTIAFPLRESIHFLGDTQVRIRALLIFSERAARVALEEWSKRLHANPLDIGVDFLLPIQLHRTGLPVRMAVSCVSFLLALVYFAGVWRLVRRLRVPAESRVALSAALVLAGTLEAFAGYAESVGLLLAVAVWWWAELLAPLDGPRRALKAGALWLVLFLSHRLGLVMLVPQLWRSLGPGLDGDRPAARRLLLVLTLAGAALAGGFLAAGVGAQQLGMDFGDLWTAARGRGGAGPLPLYDVVNTLLLLAPLFLLAAVALGQRMREALREPRLRTLLVGSILLLPLAWLLPSGVNGLGAHRDWDLNALLGCTLTLLAGSALARLPAARLRVTLMWGLPLLALQAGAWVAVNASESASLRRALALAASPSALPESNRSHLLVFLGQRAMDVSQPEYAARYYEKAFDLNPNPRRALLSAEAWALAGHAEAAGALVARARASGPLSPSLRVAAERLDSLILRVRADSLLSSARDSAARAP